MRGARAGELGQTQFMPSSWMKYAVDFDGNGRRDLLHSAPDVLALDRELSRRLRLATRQGLSAGRAQFRGAAAVEQERGLRQDDRLFREPARQGAIAKPAAKMQGADRLATAAPGYRDDVSDSSNELIQYSCLLLDRMRITHENSRLNRPSGGLVELSQALDSRSLVLPFRGPVAIGNNATIP